MSRFFSQNKCLIEKCGLMWFNVHCTTTSMFIHQGCRGVTIFTPIDKICLTPVLPNIPRPHFLFLPHPQELFTLVATSPLIQRNSSRLCLNQNRLWWIGEKWLTGLIYFIVLNRKVKLCYLTTYCFNHKTILLQAHTLSFLIMKMWVTCKNLNIISSRHSCSLTH